MKLSLFIFTRDFRLEDNTALNRARLESDVVIPIFVFNNEQIDSSINKFYNTHCVRFMIESLIDLDKKLRMHKSKLYLFYGDIYNIVKKLIKQLKIYKIYINEDITPYAIKRSNKLKEICSKYNTEFSECRDLFLLETQFEKKSYMFSSYYKKILKNKILKPKLIKINNFYNKKLNTINFDFILDKLNISLENSDKSYQTNGGRKEALKKLINLQIPSGLSPYIKFGCLSIREIYWYVGKTHESPKRQLVKENFIRSLIWRDFYYQLYYQDKKLFNYAQDNPWNNNKIIFNKWCNGETGYPIIDAGMRELKETGYMVNRLRMLVACFLVKILYVDWKKGEKWFAKYLLDYDPILNNGNWQWIAGTHRGSKLMWNRILNPWIQSKKIDENGKYIKKWIPELKDVETKDIHKYNEMRYKYNNSYCDAIVNFDTEKIKINKRKMKK
jgi:deoxyribodipyrimidine photo-lyase